MGADLDRVDGGPRPEAEAALRAVCGATRWIERMMEGRPYGNCSRLFAAAEHAWSLLGPDDWMEAFAEHPRLGGADLDDPKFAATRAWSQGEQAGLAMADERTLRDLTEGQAVYEARFGYIFLFCAAGRSSDEMAASLTERLTHDPATEIEVAAEELRRIVQLRLEKLCRT